MPRFINLNYLDVYNCYLFIMICTIFENISETKNPYYISINTALQRIKNGKSEKQINKIRACNNKDERNELKSELPCILYAGKFSQRFDNKIIQHSGFIALDFDSITNINELKEAFKNDKYVYAVWISPSGNGIKVLVQIPVNPEKHKNYFYALQQHFDCSTFDSRCSNLSRVCYESYDPDIFINPKSEIFNKTIEPVKRTPVKVFTEKFNNVNDSETYEKLLIWLNKKESFVQGNRNNYLYLLASAMNVYGINKDNALSILEYDFSSMKKEIQRIVKSAYHNVESHNTKSFSKLQKHQYKVDVKVGNIGNKANIKNFFVDDLQQLAKYLDKNFPKWTWVNIFNNEKKGNQLGSFTNKNRPNSPNHIPNIKGNN